MGLTVSVAGAATLVAMALACSPASAETGTPAPSRAAGRAVVPAASGASRAARTSAVVKPVNLLCPVMTGTPVDPAFTSVWQGKLVGFSSADAKGRWDKSPAAFAKNLAPESLDLFDTHPTPVAVTPERPAKAAPVAAKPTAAPASAAAPTPAAARTAAPVARAAAPARPAAAVSSAASRAAPAPRIATQPAPRAATPVAPRVLASPRAQPVRTQPVARYWSEPDSSCSTGGG